MDPFSHSAYFARKKFLKIFGGEIRIFDQNRDNLLFFVKQKAFKLKEDITIFADEAQSQALLRIQARSIIDFMAAYDVTDLRTNQKVGALRRKGLASLLRDSWEILDANDNAIATVKEDSMLLALLRRFFTNLIPQSFAIDADGSVVGALKQTFNPFVPQFNVDFSMDTGAKLDRRLGVATVVLLQIIEGKQEGG